MEKGGGEAVRLGVKRREKNIGKGAEKGKGGVVERRKRRIGEMIRRGERKKMEIKGGKGRRERGGRIKREGKSGRYI